MLHTCPKQKVDETANNIKYWKKTYDMTNMTKQKERENRYSVCNQLLKDDGITITLVADKFRKLC